MRRRIELHGDFASAGGTGVRTPANLAARIEAEPCIESEIWQQFEDGDLFCWRQQGGWGSLVQRLERFHQHNGGEALLGVLRTLRQDSGIRDRNQTAGTVGRASGRPGAPSLRSLIKRTPTRHGTGPTRQANCSRNSTEENEAARGVRVWEGWRDKKTGWLRLGLYASSAVLVVVALLFIFKNIIERREPQPPVIYKALRDSPETKQAPKALADDAAPNGEGATENPRDIAQTSSDVSAADAETRVQSASVEEIIKSVESQLERGDYDGALKDAEHAVRLSPRDGRAKALPDRVRGIRSILS